MSIGVIWNLPIDQQTYDQIHEKVSQGALDKGMRVHAAGEGDGAWRIIEVWDSREGLHQFIAETLTPAVDDVSQGQAPPPEPELVYDIYSQEP
jgi:hypothetical protein